MLTVVNVFLIEQGKNTSCDNLYPSLNPFDLQMAQKDQAHRK